MIHTKENEELMNDMVEKLRIHREAIKTWENYGVFLFYNVVCFS